MNTFIKYSIRAGLIALAGVLAADIFFGIEPLLGPTSLLLLMSALGLLAWKLDHSEKKLFERAILYHVHRETSREMNLQLREAREKPRFRSNDDSQVNQVIAS